MGRRSAIFLAAGLVGLSAVGLSFGHSQPSEARPFTLKQPVAIELFTSQGCSSCPPADRLLEKLAKHDNIVAMSRPVTYWDRLGWKDTLAREENTELQRAYARRGLAGRNGVYTPQLAVDGERGAIGSREGRVWELIAAASRAPAAIALRPQKNGSLIVGWDGKTPDKAELVLVAMKSHETVRIARGENGNRSLGYTNVVRNETRIADWNGGKSNAKIPASLLQQQGADRYALLLRIKGSGPILAARNIPAR